MEHAVPTFVDVKGEITDESNVLFCEFAKHMSAQPGMTINIWKNTFNWMQFELSNQVGACNKPRPVGHIRRLKIVEDEAQKIKSTTSDLEKTNENGEIVYFDMQSKLESDTPDEKNDGS